MSIAATLSTYDPSSYKSGSHKGSYGSSNKGAPDYEPEEIMDIRRLVYENPQLGSFGAWTFQDLEDGEAEAQHALDFIKSRRYTFVFPEQADMYLSALAYMFFQTNCEEYLKTTKNMSLNELNREVKKTKHYYELPTQNRPLTCKQKVERFREIFHKIRKGMINTVSRQGGANIEGRVDTIIREATGGNLDEQFFLSELAKYSHGGRRRKTRRNRKATRRVRKSYRKVNRKTRRN